MQRRLRILVPLALLVVVGVGAAILLGARWLDETLSAESVAAQASERLGHDVLIRSLDVHFTPWLRVRLEGVAIGDEATLEAVEVGPRLLALLQGRVEVGRVEIEEASLRLTRS